MRPPFGWSFCPILDWAPAESVTPLLREADELSAIFMSSRKLHGQTRKAIAPMDASAGLGPSRAPGVPVRSRAFPALPAFLLQLHHQDVIGQSDRLLNGGAVALLECNFVGHRMTKRGVTFVDS